VIINTLSISGRLGLNLHSLNNEGGEGNQIATRQVTVVDPEGRLHNVNAISGDMFKHIQAEHLAAIARQEGLPLCKACARLDPNRIQADEAFLKQLSRDTRDDEIIDLMLETCVVDDLEGNLITAGNKNTPRKSLVEFGWVVGIPDQTKTESYFHVKYVRDPGTARGEEAANLGQNIFHRPANSGVYAVVLSLDAGRIGFNDFSRRYIVDPSERLRRFRALLQSVLYTFLRPNGAMRNTQNPHITSWKGSIVISGSVIPAPTVSPLNPDYQRELHATVEELSRLEVQAESIVIFDFSSLSDFARIMGSLIERGRPYSLV